MTHFVIFKKSLSALIFISIVIFNSGCTISHEEHSVLERVKRHSEKLSYEQMNLEDIFRGVKRVSVAGEGKKFFAGSRTDKILRFPCSSCHEQGKPSVPYTSEEPAAHWGLSLEHNRDMVCKTCHNLNDMDTLVKLNGDLLSFDHSYTLCAQCHFEQHRDWIGGSHGKRVGGWVRPRIIFNCTGCHNPHNPSIDKRLPNTMFRQLRQVDLR